MAEQDDPAIGKWVLCQLIAQAAGGGPAEGEEILVALTLQAQRLRQFTLFTEQAIGFVFSAVNPVQLRDHVNSGRRRLQ